MRAMQKSGSALGRGVIALLALLSLAALTGCGSKSSKASTTVVGVSVGVGLTTATGSTLIYQGTTLEIDASVVNDASNSGVTWQLSGPGTLTSVTKTTVVYVGPTSVTGSVAATLTAVAVADTKQTASVTITVNGTPTITPITLFPANQNIAYGAGVTVTGGLGPYTWAVTSGTLPAGLSLNGSTTQTIGITGTPTAIGSSTFTLTVTDANSGKASIVLTLSVNEKTACLLQGHYSYVFVGFKNQLPVVRAGAFNVGVDGTMSGVADYKDANGARVADAESQGLCKTTTQNRGTLKMVSTNTTETFDFGVAATLSKGHMQEDDGSAVVGSAQFFQQDTSAFSQTILAGDYSFGLVGSDGASGRLGVVGRLTLSPSGTIANGQADTNSASSVAAAPVSGSWGAPDANGRGTATLAVNGLSLPIAYYVVDANTLFVVSNDTAKTTPRLAGRMSRQLSPNGFDASALSGPSIVSLFGTSLVQGLPAGTFATGRLSGALAGSVSLLLDTADRGTPLVTNSYTGVPYTVAANGRGTLAINAVTPARNFVFYLSSPGNGYILESGSTFGNFGFLDAQIGVPFTSYSGADYVGGTVFPVDDSPITLTSQIVLQGGLLSGNLTGNYALDTSTGRMEASVSQNIFGGTGLVMYLVSPTKLVVMGNSVNSVNSQIAWLQTY